MTAEDALAYLVAEDAARRTREGRDEAYGLRLGGRANRKRLIAWRRENGLCPKCGRAIPVDEVEYKHCPKCRAAFRHHQRHVNANLTEPQRRARNERERQRYHKIMHGRPAPPRVAAPKRTRVAAPVVTPLVTPVAAPTGPRRDRAAYMRAYRAAGRAGRAET